MFCRRYIKMNNSKNNKYHILAWCIVLAWMVMIFCFSAQVADESSETSGRIVGLILKLFGLEENTDEAELLTFIIRKGAHFTEYTILALWCINALQFTKPRYYPVIAWLIASLYAVSDEIHQLFVEGRSCEIRDMCIDGAGALLGVLIGIIITKNTLKRRSQNEGLGE